MTKIEIYSADFDSNQDICNGGLSNKVFVTDSTKQYECKSVSEAFNSIDFHDLTEIVLYYQKNNIQLFKKLTV